MHLTVSDCLPTVSAATCVRQWGASCWMTAGIYGPFSTEYIRGLNVSLYLPCLCSLHSYFISKGSADDGDDDDDDHHHYEAQNDLHFSLDF